MGIMTYLQLLWSWPVCQIRNPCYYLWFHISRGQHFLLFEFSSNDVLQMLSKDCRSRALVGNAHTAHNHNIHCVPSYFEITNQQGMGMGYCVCGYSPPWDDSVHGHSSHTIYCYNGILRPNSLSKLCPTNRRFKAQPPMCPACAVGDQYVSFIIVHM